MQLLEKADERRGEGVIAQFAPVHPLVLGAPYGVGLEFGGVDGNVKYLVGEPVLKAESCRRKAPPFMGRRRARGSSATRHHDEAGQAEHWGD